MNFKLKNLLVQFSLERKLVWILLVFAAPYLVQAQTITSPNKNLSLQFELKDNGHVVLEIYDINGKRVQTLVNERKPSGTYKVVFDVAGKKHLSSGVYFYKLTADDFTDVKKMILVK